MPGFLSTYVVVVALTGPVWMAALLGATLSFILVFGRYLVTLSDVKRDRETGTNQAR
ncbi:MAG: hypothetical protein ACRDWS_03915 [Acidimicrobiia bacterium]